MGIRAVFMSDYLFLCAATGAEGQALLDKVVAVLRALELKLQKGNCTNSAQQVVSLGILIDSVTMRPRDSRQDRQRTKFKPSSSLFLEDATGPTSTTVTPSNPNPTVRFIDLESLIGKLEWNPP